MAASTIPNSGGPGSSIELSPVTIAVRDKVIEKFVDQPLDEMNESVKKLLSNEQDEQKRLGILAARVFILRTRISKIAEGDPDRVVGSASPQAADLIAATDMGDDAESGAGEWTRLRILEDCEVNGVRFPKTVIIDVKTVDADRLIASGNAELVAEAPASGEANVASPDVAEMVEPSDTGEAAEPVSATPADDGDDDLSALSAAMETAPAPVMAVEEPPEPEAAAPDSEKDAAGEAVIDAPSAAEVTAALEALSGGDNDAAADTAPAPVTTDVTADVPEDAAADVSADASDNADDAADVAAELEALSAALASDGDASADEGDSDSSASDAADVAAELQAAAAAMAAGPSNPDTTDLPPAGGEDDGDGEEDGDKPAGWFEAQQNAEQSKRGEDKSDDDDA